MIEELLTLLLISQLIIALDCGYSGEINDKCPKCGSDNIQYLRRVTGYLTADYKTRFNLGKRAEVEDRVKHSRYTDFTNI